MSKTAWITGARGFIGRHLARRLANGEVRVAGLGHGLWPEAGIWGVLTWVNGDIHASYLNQLLQAEGPPDRLYHLAGGSSVATAAANPLEDFHRTVTTTVELLDWVRLTTSQTRVIAISSAAVYGTGQIGKIPETCVGKPYSQYGRHKLLMEQICQGYAADYGLPIVIARLFSAYGPFLKKQLLWDLSAKLSVGGDLLLGGSGEELRDWTDVRDVVRALDLVASAASPEAPVLNVGTGRGTTVRDIVALALRAWPASQAPAFSGRARPGDPFSLIADNAALENLGFDWQIPVEQGIADYVEWSRVELGPSS